MTAGCPDRDAPARPPILALGLGNLLLTDDGAGLRLVKELASSFVDESRVEFVDGGTMGLSLLGVAEARQAILILDAVGLGAAPGSVHALDETQVREFRARRAGTAHEGNALGLLEALTLLGLAPRTMMVVGIEPEVVRTGAAGSPVVEAAVDAAVAAAHSILRKWLDSTLGNSPRSGATAYRRQGSFPELR
jgi:hydrogenase maturation protease